MNTEDIYYLIDKLYTAGYEDRRKERNYDPRGCDEWQDVFNVLSKQNRLVQEAYQEGILVGSADDFEDGLEGI